MCQAPPGLGGVVLPLGSLGPSTGSREPSRVRPRLLDPTPLRRAVRRDWHVTSRKRRDMPIPSILPTVSRVEASKALWPRVSPSQSGLDVAVSCWRGTRPTSSIAYSPTPSIVSESNMQAPCIAAEVLTRPSHAHSIVPQRANLSGKIGACAGFAPPRCATITPSVSRD